MQFFFDISVTAQQRAWIASAIGAFEANMDIYDFPVTFQTVLEPPCPGHTDYMCTQTFNEPGIGYTALISIRELADSLELPMNRALPDPPNDLKHWFMEGICHELAHVITFLHFDDDGLRTDVAELFHWEREPGRRGTLADWNPLGSDWTDRIQEAVAEVMKDAWLPSVYRVYDNRTNWDIDPNNWKLLREMMEPAFHEEQATGVWQTDGNAISVHDLLCTSVYRGEYADPPDNTKPIQPYVNGTIPFWEFYSGLHPGVSLESHTWRRTDMANFMDILGGCAPSIHYISPGWPGPLIADFRLAKLRGVPLALAPPKVDEWDRFELIAFTNCYTGDAGPISVSIECGPVSASWSGVSELEDDFAFFRRETRIPDDDAMALAAMCEGGISPDWEIVIAATPPALPQPTRPPGHSLEGVGMVWRAIRDRIPVFPYEDPPIPPPPVISGGVIRLDDPFYHR